MGAPAAAVIDLNADLGEGFGRWTLTDDDALLAEMSTVLDSLYAHFRREAGRPHGPGSM